MRKTLLLTLLTCWVSLMTAFAAEEHYTIMFKTGTNTQTTLKTTDAASAYISSGAEFISAPSAITNVIPETDKGISIGSNNNKGSLTLTLSEAGKKEITKIVLKSAQSKSGTITLTVNGVDASATNTASDLQYVFAAPALQSTIKIDASKKSYILGMEVYYEGSETPGPAMVAAPEFTPAGGNVTPETEISLSCATEGASIWWQNGDAEATEYAAPFTLPEGTHTLTAWAAKDGMTDSEIATASFVVKNAVTPLFMQNRISLLRTPHSW